MVSRESRIATFLNYEQSILNHYVFKMPLDANALNALEMQIDALLQATQGEHGLTHEMDALQLLQQEAADVEVPQPYSVGQTRVTIADLTAVHAVEGKHNKLKSRIQYLINLKLQTQLTAALAAAQPGAGAGEHAQRTRTFSEDEERLISVMKGLRVQPPAVFEGQSCGLDPHAWMLEFDPYFEIMQPLGGTGYSIPLPFKIQFIRTRLGASGKSWFDMNQTRPEFVTARASWEDFKKFFVHEMSLVDQRNIDRQAADTIRFTTAQQLYRELQALQQKVGKDPASQSSLTDGLLARKFYEKLPKAMQEEANKMEEFKRSALGDRTYTLTMDELLQAAMIVEKSDSRYRLATRAHHGTLPGAQLNAITDNALVIPETAPPMDTSQAFMALMGKMDQQQHMLNALQQQQQYLQQSTALPLPPPPAQTCIPGQMICPPIPPSPQQLNALATVEAPSPAHLYSMYGDDLSLHPVEAVTEGDEPMDSADESLFALLQRNHRTAQRQAMQHGTGAGPSTGMLPPKLQARVRCHNCGEFGHMMRQCTKPARFKKGPVRLMHRRPSPGNRMPMRRPFYRPKTTRNFRSNPQGQLSVVNDEEVMQGNDDEMIWSIDEDVASPYFYA